MEIHRPIFSDPAYYPFGLIDRKAGIIRRRARAYRFTRYRVRLFIDPVPCSSDIHKASFPALKSEPRL